MAWKSCFSYLLFVAFGFCLVFSQNHDAEIQKMLDKLHAKNQFNGAILVIEQGKCVFKKAFGVQEYGKKESLTIHTPFNLAEASAGFTSMAIAILQDRALLDWDDRIARFLPELPYQNIRIRDLLWHTSGLPDYFLLCEKYWDRQRPVNNHDLLDLLRIHEPRLKFPRGMNFEFSNINYALLALIVERVSKQPFSTFLQTEIFDPLEMQDAFVFGSREEEKDFPSTYLDGIVGDKGIYVSIEDMHKWVNALQNHRFLSEAGEASYLEAGSLANGMTTYYAMGWVRIDSPAVVFHDGAWRGFHSTVVLYTQKKHAIVLLSNSSDRVVSIQRRIAKILEERRE